jgi:transcriptional regulator with XRE-family HTH domain
MTNERLRTALFQRGETPTSVAEALGVDPKTVERWIEGRVPYRRSRFQLARHLQVEESYLWPDAVSPQQLASASESELVGFHPHRGIAPRDIWTRLFDSAEEEIGILVYSGYFLLVDSPGVVAMLTSKAEAGVRVRILLGDPDSRALRERGADEGIDDLLEGRVRNVIVMLKPLLDVNGIEIRLHSTTLYNSIYRADDELLVNPHIYGFGAAQAPIIQLRQIVGGTMVTTYLDSFERVWASARSLSAGT